MPRSRAVPLFLSMAVLSLMAGRAGAQHEHGGDVPLPPGFDQPMALYRTALGPYGRRITTSSDDAQAYFNQGMQFVFAFTLGNAARSFREAEKLDPACAMCFWGEAYAWGSYLNGDMRAEDAPAGARSDHPGRGGGARWGDAG